MNHTDATWQTRLIAQKRGRTGDLTLGYTNAIQALEDHTADPDNPYWGSSEESDNYCVIVGESMVFDEYGGETSAEGIRALAFELLVLADLADMQAAA